MLANGMFSETNAHSADAQIDYKSHSLSAYKSSEMLFARKMG